MEATRYLVRTFVEFTAGMEHRQNNLKGALVLFGVHIYRDTAAVVDHFDGVVGVDGHFDVCGIACHGLIDGVVYNLVHKVMEAFFGNIADIHRRAFAHCLQAFEDLNVTGAVFLFFFYHILRWYCIFSTYW